MKSKIIIACIVLSVLALLQAPKIIFIFVGMAAAALLASRQLSAPRVEDKELDSSGYEPFESPPTEHMTLAITNGQRELGLTQDASATHIAVEFDEQPTEIHIDYRGQCAFLAIHIPMGEPTEMVCVVRRRKSALPLAPIVDNTPVSTEGFEYRLRTIPLNDACEARLIAATNRPRLFRTLINAGLESDLMGLLDNPHFLVEDLVYNGTELRVIVQPAIDPATSPYIVDTLTTISPITRRFNQFLADTPIPSARS